LSKEEPETDAGRGPSQEIKRGGTDPPEATREYGRPCGTRGVFHLKGIVTPIAEERG